MPPPIKVAEDRWISFSMGAIWTIAIAAVVGVGALCGGIIKVNTFLDSFNEFKATTLAYQEQSVANYKGEQLDIRHILQWEGAADVRRALVLPISVNKDTLETTLHEQSDLNADVLHADPARKGIYQPSVVVKPIPGLPDIKATVPVN